MLLCIVRVGIYDQQSRQIIDQRDYGHQQYHEQYRADQREEVRNGIGVCQIRHQHADFPRQDVTEVVDREFQQQFVCRERESPSSTKCGRLVFVEDDLYDVRQYDQQNERKNGNAVYLWYRTQKREIRDVGFNEQRQFLESLHCVIVIGWILNLTE